MDAELVIEGARVIDDARDQVADVAITGGRIAAVAPGLPLGSVQKRIDGRGHILAPGFIDLHAHSALRVFDEPQLEAKVAQGFTTELICPDGLGPAPVTPALLSGRRRYLRALEPSDSAPWSWRSLADYLAEVAAARPATNMVTCAPHSAIREAVMGGADRPAEAHEMAEMQQLTRDCFEAGARALSFGLIYAPGLYADTRELTALAEVAAEYQAPLVPHVRNEASGVLTAIGEFIRVSEKTGAPLHVSHVKLVGSPDLLADLLSMLSDAEERIRFTFDQYPYGAGSTILAALLPPYAFDGGPEATLGRLRDKSEKARMAHDMEHGLVGWENLLSACGPDNVLITQAAGPRVDDIGKSIAQIADEHGGDPAMAIFDLLADTDLDAGMIDHYSTETVVREIFSHPKALVGSDGVFNPHPHPRLYGTAAKVLGRLALHDQLIDAQEAIKRLTSRPAQLLGLDDRGSITDGLRADLVLLDPDRFIDQATYANPCKVPDGVHTVLVAGQPVWTRGAPTGHRPGTVCQTRAA